MSTTFESQGSGGIFARYGSLRFLPPFRARLGVILDDCASFLMFLGALWSSGAGLWTTLGRLGDRGNFLADPGQKYYILLGYPLAPQIPKVAKKHPKTVSGKQCRKSAVPEHPQNGKLLILYSNYHMFREVGHPQFECLLVSIRLPFGVVF